jgi:hypothetical protein
MTAWVYLTHSIDPDFYEARAIVFSKMGQHRQVLEIYVFKLYAHDKAEEYVEFHIVSSPR